MEQNKKAVIEKLQQMKVKAQETLASEGLNLYVMHATCAVELAEQAIALLEAAPESAAPKMDGAHVVMYEFDDNGNLKREFATNAIISMSYIQEDGGYVQNLSLFRNIDKQILLNLYASLLETRKDLLKKSPILAILETPNAYEKEVVETEASDAEVQDGFKV